MRACHQRLSLPQPFRGIFGRPNFPGDPARPIFPAFRAVRVGNQTSALVGGNAATQAPRKFFNRDKEQEILNVIFNARPGVITVLLGPPDCENTVSPGFVCSVAAAGFARLHSSFQKEKRVVNLNFI